MSKGKSEGGLKTTSILLQNQHLNSNLNIKKFQYAKNELFHED